MNRRELCLNNRLQRQRRPTLNGMFACWVTLAATVKNSDLAAAAAVLVGGGGGSVERQIVARIGTDWPGSYRRRLCTAARMCVPCAVGHPHSSATFRQTAEARSIDNHGSVSLDYPGSVLWRHHLSHTSSPGCRVVLTRLLLEKLNHANILV